MLSIVLNTLGSRFGILQGNSDSTGPRARLYWGQKKQLHQVKESVLTGS